LRNFSGYAYPKKEFNQQKEEAPQNISLDMLKGLQDKFKK